MADLQDVDFALMPGPARKQKQFQLPEDFSNMFITILSRTSHPGSGFSAVFHNTDGPLFGDLQIFYTTTAQQEISTFPLSEVEIVA